MKLILSRLISSSLLLACSASSRPDADPGNEESDVCREALTPRKSGNAPCSEDRCDYLASRPDRQVSFRMTLQRTSGTGRELSEKRRENYRACVGRYLEQRGLKVVSLNEGPSEDVIVAGKYSDFEPARRLDVITWVEPGCVGGCVHCRALAPGEECDADPFCQSVFARPAELEGACVRLGSVTAVACIDDGEPCGERAAQAVSEAGQCWFFESADCPTIVSRGWEFRECVPWDAKSCSP